MTRPRVIALGKSFLEKRSPGQEEKERDGIETESTCETPLPFDQGLLPKSLESKALRPIP